MKDSCKLCLKDNILEHASLKHPTYIFNECQQKTRALKHRYKRIMYQNCIL